MQPGDCYREGHQTARISLSDGESQGENRAREKKSKLYQALTLKSGTVLTSRQGKFDDLKDFRANPTLDIFTIH